MLTQVLLLCLWVLMICECHGTQYIDLSHDIGEKTATWPTHIPFSRKSVANGFTPGGFWLEYYDICMSEHTGTHMDAPGHFSQGKWYTDQIPLSHLIAPGVVIDMQQKARENPNAELTLDDFNAWLKEHGPLPDGVIIFIRTGWVSRYGDNLAYYGSATNDTSNLMFPGISIEVAQALIVHKEIAGSRIFGVGIDGPGIDNGASKDFKCHQILYAANIYGLENVASLDKLPTKGFDVIVLPMKLRKGTGAPTRIVAILPSSGQDINLLPRTSTDSGTGCQEPLLIFLIVSLIFNCFL